VARQTAGQKADLQGAAGVSSADLEGEAAGVLAGGQDLDNDGDVDEDDDDAAALTGTEDEAPGLDWSAMPPARRRGPGHEDVTADWADYWIPPGILPYLKRDELRVISMRRHVIRLAGPAAAFVGGLVLAIALNGWAYSSGHAAPLAVHVIWWAWIIGAGWAVYKWLEWRQTWFVVTGFRLMLVETTRLLGRRVRMLPLDKLRDLEFSQTPLGRWQGYATFTFASIGTGGNERALTEVDYLPEPEWLYQQINQLTMPSGTGRIVRKSGS
jgi:Bacterial PH domain